MFDSIKFGAAVKRARLACGRTQESLSEYLYCSQAYISQIERGEAVPSLPMFVDIAQSLHVNPSELLGYNSEQTSPPPALNTTDKAVLCEELYRIILLLIST